MTIFDVDCVAAIYGSIGFYRHIFRIIGVELWDTWQFFVGLEHSLLNISKGKYLGEENKAKVRPLSFYIGTAFMF